MTATTVEVPDVELGPPVTARVPAVLRHLYDPPLGAVRYRTTYGGRGGVKSWGIADALLILGSRQPLRIGCFREFQSSLKESVLELLKTRIKALSLGGVYTTTKTAIFGRSGTEFIFAGLRHNPQTIKSLEGIDIAWIEEAQNVSKESWDILIPTIRRPNSEIWTSFNPYLEDDETYKRLVLKPPPRSIVVQTGFWDNPFLPDVLAEEEASLRERDPDGHANIWLGETLKISDAVVLNGKYRVDIFDVPTDPEAAEAAGWGYPYFGGDFGFAVDPSQGVKLWTRDDRLWLEYEAGGVKLDNDALFQAWSGIPGALDHVWLCDSARPETINELKKRGLRAESVEKWDGSVKDGIQHLRSYKEIVIHSRCQLATREARLYRYKTDPRTSLILPILIDAHNHTWDAVRYALSRLIRPGRRIRFSTAEPSAE